MKFPWQKNKPTIITKKMMQAEKSFINALTSTVKRAFSGFSNAFNHNGERDYNSVFGYPDFMDYTMAYYMYRRGGIASVVVDKVAKACWRNTPIIEENGKPVLENEVLKLKSIGAFKALEKADILNRIGNFSVLLVGIPDGNLLHQPLGTANSFDGVYFMPYSYEGVDIAEWDTDPISNRYGLPKIYTVRTVNLGDKNKETKFETKRVHWSRIVHLAEGSLDSLIEGTSSLQAPYNALLDKEKVRGGSSEAFYKNSKRTYTLEADKDTEITDTEKLNTEIDEFNNENKNFMRLQGIKANVLSPSLVSPRESFDICIEEVSGVTGIPVRILTGKGGGQLAGTEDRASWNALVADRAENECADYYRDLLKIFDNAGLLKLPKIYDIVFPPQTALSESEAVDIVDKKATAFQKVTSGLSNVAGDSVDAESAFISIGIRDIKFDKLSLPDDLDK